jgi:hypothetical protein
LGFDDLIDMYKNDPYFKEVYEAVENPILRDRSQWVEYMIQEGLLFKGNQLCIPKCSMRENLLKEKHSGGLVKNFGHDKTFEKLNESYFWLGMRENVKIFVDRCRIYQHSKGGNKMQGFINRCPYLRSHGMQSAWISYWGCQEHKEVLNQYLWSWIDFPRWHTSFHVRRIVMQLTL